MIQLHTQVSGILDFTAGLVIKEIASGNLSIPDDESFEPEYHDFRKGDTFAEFLPLDTLAEKIYIYTKWLIYQGIVFSVANTDMAEPKGGQKEILSRHEELRSSGELNAKIKEGSLADSVLKCLADKVDQLEHLLSGELMRHVPKENIPESDSSHDLCFDIRKGNNIVFYKTFVLVGA